MNMKVIAISLPILFIFFLSYLRQIWSNWRRAKRFNLPIVISPFNPYGILWQLFHKQLRKLFSFLPEPLSTFTRVTGTGWEYDDKGRIHRQLGSAFVIVSPGRNEIVISEPRPIHEVLANPKTFHKPKLYEPLNVFGPNVNTTNDEVWARHRKLTAPCFNERVSRTVWEAASLQAQSMLERTIGLDPSRAYTEVSDDTKVLALHVLMEAGLGISQPFSGGVRNPGPGHTVPFGEALFRLLENLLLVIVFSPLFKPTLLPFLPKSVREAGQAMHECGLYYDEIIEQAMVSDTTQNNLISALARASKQEDREKDGRYGSGGLTKDEMRGNLHIFTFAGHETTANTMAYAISLLAAHPQWQDWIVEELHSVFDEHDRGNYEEVFPRLKRCQALMYETLRLYGPVTWVPRETARDAEIVSLGNTGSKASIVIPRNTDLHLNMYARQVSTNIWGPDALQFRPDRFILSVDQPVPKDWVEHGNVSDGKEKLVAPPLPYFSPWLSGPRICPGMKFSQVEFVAAISTIFSKARICPFVAGIEGRLETGRESENVYQDLRSTIQKSEFRGATLFISQPDDIRLTWKMREGGL